MRRGWNRSRRRERVEDRMRRPGVLLVGLRAFQSIIHFIFDSFNSGQGSHFACLRCTTHFQLNLLVIKRIIVAFQHFPLLF